MASELDFAVLSALVYNNVRSQPNKLLIPNDWDEIAYDPYGAPRKTSFFKNRRYKNQQLTFLNSPKMAVFRGTLWWPRRFH
jgi:hypothetical protein